MENKRDILGRGWKFPIRIDARGGFAYSSDEQLIQESIWIILGTALNERHMLPRFGCGIHDLVFSPNSPGARGAIANQVKLALTRWEPRITVQDVRVEVMPPEQATSNHMLIRINYRISSDNRVQNLVYPFYVEEQQT
jgi:hypothetical protein